MQSHVMRVIFLSAILTGAAAAPAQTVKITPLGAQAGEYCATEGGKRKAGSPSADFVRLVKGRKVHLPLSGRRMAFDGKGKCLAGC